MKVFEFESKLATKSGGACNIIYSTPKGFYVVTISSRSHKQDIKNSKVIFYKTIDSLKKNSKAFAKTFTTYIVKMNGTDFAKATVKKI